MNKLDPAAVLAVIDEKLEATERLLTNRYAKAMDRRVLASNINVLRSVRESIEGMAR